MSARAVGRRYAAALFDVAEKAGAIDRAGQDLAAFATLVTGHEELRRVLETPALPPQKKRAIVQALVDAAADMGPEVQRLLLFVAERDRVRFLPDIAAAFAERVTEAKRIRPAIVVTAVPLGGARLAQLSQALGKAAGGDVRITETVDPTILGGVVARVGSVVFDGSVSRQIERMKQRLLTET